MRGQWISERRRGIAVTPVHFYTIDELLTPSPHLSACPVRHRLEGRETVEDGAPGVDACPVCRDIERRWPAVKKQYG
jgi:hypothetical protein